MWRIATITAAIWVLTPLMVWADDLANPSATPETLWRSWNWDALILLNLSLLGAVYVRGWNRIRTKSGFAQRVSRAQLAAFLCSLCVLLAALISPLHALSEELAAAHMVQHMLLMVVAAPLFVFGSPGHVLLWGLEPDWRPWAAGWIRTLNTSALHTPLLPWILHTTAIWLWHWPVAYQAALVDPLVHDAQHLSFFAAACLYWRPLLDPRCRREFQPLAAVASLFATSLQAMLLGIFLALSPTVWYDDYGSRSAAWGLSPLEDQQLAGFIMWLPACLIYPALAAMALGKWLATQPHLQKRSPPLQGI
jgi:cytochrome c oxidase assembly factor CtaG